MLVVSPSFFSNQLTCMSSKRRRWSFRLFLQSAGDPPPKVGGRREGGGEEEEGGGEQEDVSVGPQQSQ